MLPGLSVASKWTPYNRHGQPITIFIAPTKYCLNADNPDTIRYVPIAGPNYAGQSNSS